MDEIKVNYEIQKRDEKQKMRLQSYAKRIQKLKEKEKK